MSSEFLLKTAAVLEAAAAVLDEHEAKTQTAVKLAREGALSSLTAEYTRLTGEELPDDVLKKLAASDESVLGAVKQVFAKTAGAVESLGGSGGPVDSTPKPPSTKKEAADNAWNKFGSFINS